MFGHITWWSVLLTFHFNPVPTNIMEMHRFGGGGGGMVWAGVMLDGCIDLNVFHGRILIALRYRTGVLEPCVRIFRSAVDPQFIFMEDNARPHMNELVKEYLEAEDTECMKWPVKFANLNPIDHLIFGLNCKAQ